MASSVPKKQLRSQVVETLTTTFGNLAGGLTPKQFKRNVKKASKVLLDGVKYESEKKPVKKASSKKKLTEEVVATT